MSKRDYWKDRLHASRDALLSKSQREIDRRVKKYYQKLSKQVIDDYEATYEKLLTTIEDGREPTVADLYKLDRYWSMNVQLTKRLEKLGAQMNVLYSKVFMSFYKSSYNAFSIEGMAAFKTINDEAVKRVIESIWCSDGRSWSQRIWNNTQLLKQTLEDELIHCVVTGKKTSQLKKVLQERFNVSYSQADMLARTELCHIQSEAAKQRYQDYGITKVQWWAEKDERQCPTCGKLHKKIYPVGASIPIPNHPNCRCQIIPVVDIPQENINE